MIGRKQAIGPVFCTPISPDSQPHWKPAVTAPKRPATDSRKPRAALIGTTNDRNTTSRSRTDKPTTMAPNGTRADESRDETSTPVAVLPVTPMRAPVDCSIALARPRIALTTSSVATAEGALDGMTWIKAVLLSVLSRGGVTETTPVAVFNWATTFVACCCAVVLSDA